MATLRKDIRDKIVDQSLNEIQFARQYKQGKVTNWHKNEDLYFAKKAKSEDSRANVDLGRMQEFVHSLLSKIDNPLLFKFTKRKPSQHNRVNRLNSLRAYDAVRDNWDIKDLVGKKQGVMYGRSIYAYYADSVEGYMPHLEPVDVYDFLIDPSSGGIDIERAMYMGRYGVVKTKQQLQDGSKSGMYIKTEVTNLISGDGNATEKPQEELNKRNRAYGTQTSQTEKEKSPTDKYKMWEWFTTYEGDRYYVLLSDTGKTAIKIEKLSDVFESNLYPFWTWASFPDLTEFWTPSYCDYVREIFMAQSVSINQMLDNAEQINKPQKIVDVTLIDDLAKLKYKKDGIIESKGDTQRAVRFVETPSITTPINVFEILETIQEKASGVTGASKGIAEEDKVGIYEGNQANTADRFGLLNKSYAFGYQRFAKLYEWGVKEHLKKKVAVDILGPDGVSLEEISKRDIYWKDDTFGVMVEASNAEMALSAADRRQKLVFLANNVQNPSQNPKKAYEIQASIAGFSEDEIRQLMDTEEFGDSELISEAERDIEMIIDGKDIKPNGHANIAYKQKFVDYMTDHEEDIDNETFSRLVNYVRSLDKIIQKNVVRQAVEKSLDVASTGATLPDESQSEPLTLNPQDPDVGI